MKLKVENGVFVVKEKGVRFEPQGKAHDFGRNPAHFTVYGVPKNTARMFVGFNVGQKATWNVDDLARVFRTFRSKQKNDDGKPIPIDSSFVIQKGYYTQDNGELVYENSAQLIILSIFGESEHRFAENMIDLAGHISRELQQETVILEVQQKGVPIEVFGVTWKD
jgi:hypothetical protein